MLIIGEGCSINERWLISEIDGSEGVVWKGEKDWIKIEVSDEIVICFTVACC